jgi:hypothetical protein
MHASHLYIGPFYRLPQLKNSPQRWKPIAKINSPQAKQKHETAKKAAEFVF